MSNWKTTLAFGVAALFGFVASAFPETQPWAAPLAAAGTALGGKFAQDARK